MPTRPDVTSMYIENTRLFWPDGTEVYSSRQTDIAWGEQMSSPDVDEDAEPSWSSLGAAYNWFDKTELMAGFELRLPLTDTTRGYYDYLVNTQTSVYSGYMSSAAFISKPAAEEVLYTDSTVTVTQDLEPEPATPDDMNKPKSKSEDDTANAWIYLLVTCAVLATIVIFFAVFFCIRNRKMRKDGAASIAYQ